MMLPSKDARVGKSVPTRASAPTPVMPAVRATPVILFIIEVIAATGNLYNIIGRSESLVMLYFQQNFKC